MILDGICCPKYDRLTPRWLGEEEGGEKVHGLILGVLKGLTPRWLGEEEGGEKVHGSILGVLKGLTPRWLGEEEGKRSTVQFWGF